MGWGIAEGLNGNTRVLSGSGRQCDNMASTDSERENDSQKVCVRKLQHTGVLVLSSKQDGERVNE